MMARSALILVGLFVGVVAPSRDGASADKAQARVVEGTIISTGHKPVEGARILFCQADVGFAFADGATATADSQGRYRADLTKLPWSSDALRTMVLAPGFAPCERTIASGAGLVTMDVELKARPWKETLVRLEDQSGQPVTGVEVTFSVGRVCWARHKTDAGGCARLAMVPEMTIHLSAEPPGYRPINASIDIINNEPDLIVLPVIPPYRGRVLGSGGQPMPNVAVGRWISFGQDGVGEMMRFVGGEDTVTDREGRFRIASPVMIRSNTTRTGPPRLEALCFADAGFGQVACRFVDPTRATESMEVTLGAPRRVRVPIPTGSVAAPSKGELSSIVTAAPHLDIDDPGFYFITRSRQWKGRPTGAVSGDVIEESLPEGTYRLKVELRDADTGKLLGEAERELIVPRGDSPLNLPPLALQIPRFQQMAGKPAPEIEATDINTGQPVRLADLRGKVVVLDFWGYWCGVCNVNMPRLVELHRKFAGRPLVVLAMHDQSVQSRSEYDRKIAIVRQRLWGGRDLPFRILLDRPDPAKPEDRDPEGAGATVRRYGIEGFPTLFVIDRDGIMVEEVLVHEHDRLESLVRQLVERAEAR